jgi:hypothetical protein
MAPGRTRSVAVPMGDGAAGASLALRGSGIVPEG